MIRRWLLLVLIVLGVGLALIRRDELFEAWQTLVDGDWGWITAAAALQVGFYLWAWLYRTSFVAVGVPARLRDTLPVLVSSLAINVVVPTSGLSGAALFVDDAGLRGGSRARAAAGVILTSIADLGAVSVLMAIGLGHLASRHAVSAWQGLGAVVFFAIPVGLSLLLIASVARPAWVAAFLRVVASVIRLASRWSRRPPLPSDWAERSVSDLAAAADAIRGRPRSLVRLFGIGLAMHAVSAASLGVLFLAFHQAVAPGVVITAYSFGILAWVLSPVPQGIGVVEAAIAMVCSAFGVSPGPATVTAIAFRALTLWLPMAIGMALLWRLRSFRARGQNRRA